METESLLLVEITINREFYKIVVILELHFVYIYLNIFNIELKSGFLMITTIQ